jgi:hypothetical protein
MQQCSTLVKVAISASNAELQNCSDKEYIPVQWSTDGTGDLVCQWQTLGYQPTQFLRCAVQSTNKRYLKIMVGLWIITTSSRIFHSGIGTSFLYVLYFSLVNTVSPVLHILTYWHTPWSRVLLEKLTSFQLVNKFPTFHETQRFITAFTSARHLSMSYASSI